MKLERLQIHLTERQIKFLAEEKSRTGIKPSEFIRRVLDERINTNEDKSKEGSCH